VAVSETMDDQAPTIPESMTVREIADRIARHDPIVSKHQGTFIVDSEGNLKGVVTRSDVMRSLDEDPSGSSSVLEAGNKDVVVSYPDESLSKAAAKMLRYSIGRLAIVDRENPQKLVGYLGRREILSARLRRLEEEHVREPGWIGRFRRSRSVPTDSERSAS
jgi:chloride channel protein, CIC family